MPHREFFLSLATPEEMRLIQEIEGCLGQRIVFRMDQPHLLVHNGYASALMDKSGFKIVGDPTRPPDRHALLHELLHGHRTIVQRVPALTGASADRVAREYGSGFDNSIEHLAILPIQKHLGAFNQAYWSDQAIAAIKKMPNDPATLEFRGAVAAIIIALEAAPSHVVRQMATRKFAKARFLAEANAMRNIVKDNLHSKRLLSVRLLEWLGLLETGLFALGTFVAIGREFAFEPLNGRSLGRLEA